MDITRQDAVTWAREALARLDEVLRRPGRVTEYELRHAVGVAVRTVYLAAAVVTASEEEFRHAMGRLLANNAPTPNGLYVHTSPEAQEASRWLAWLDTIRSHVRTHRTAAVEEMPNSPEALFREVGPSATGRSVWDRLGDDE